MSIAELTRAARPPRIPPSIAPTFGLLLSVAAPTGAGVVLLLSGPAGGTTALAAGDGTGTTGTIGAGEATAGAIGVPPPLS